MGWKLLLVVFSQSSRGCDWLSRASPSVDSILVAVGCTVGFGKNCELIDLGHNVLKIEVY